MNHPPDALPAPGSHPPVKTGEALELRVTDLAYGGAGVAHLAGFAVFVRGGLPGQTVRARVIRRKTGWAEARIEDVLVHSPHETPPRCVHFGPCGGCLWQNLAYDRQLQAKAAQVRDCLERIGGIPDPPVDPPLPAIEPFGYRNKMEFSFADHVWRVEGPPEKKAPGPPGCSPPEAGAPPPFGCGLHVRGRFDKVLNLTECHLAAPWVSRVLVTVREAAARTGLSPAATRSHGGFFRFLVLREGVHTGEKMANLITQPVTAGSPEAEAVAAVLEAVRLAHPEVTSLIHGETASRASVAFCGSHRPVQGPPTIRETLLGDTFEIGPNTFFQTNSRQAERLFALALEMAGPPARTACDLYCGVGALTLPLSRRAERVVGVELVEASVEAARGNARRNGHDNVVFVAGDIRRALGPDGIRDRDGALVAGPPDLVVVDPPRDGLHAEVTAAIASLAPARMVYVSCNPSTLARDTARLSRGGYRLERAVPVDMFPQTAHVEVVAAFVPGTGS